MRRPGLTTAQCVGWTVVASWLGGWGIGQLLARTPEAGDSLGLATSCQEALVEWEPELADLSRSWDTGSRVKPLGENRYRLVLSVDGEHAHRLHFACEVVAADAGWQVTRLVRLTW